MKDIVEKLKILGFSENEALVYLHLIKNPGDNGTQISKILSVSRSAIYSALDSLEKKKIIKLIPSVEDRKNYKAFDPKIFLISKKNEIKDVFNFLENELSTIYFKYNKEDVYFINNDENLKYLLIDIFKNVKKEILISGLVDDFLNTHIKKLDTNKVNIKIFEKDSNVFIILSDNKEMIIKDDNNIMYTKNPMLISLISDKIKLEME